MAPRLPQRRRLLELFWIDLRSLALFRIALGVVLVGDLLQRVGDLTGLYSDAGAYPAATLLAEIGPGALLSVHYWASPSVPAVAGLLALAVAAAAALALGVHTRLATVVSWYLLASLHVRNPHVSRMGGDQLLIALLFWSLFLPLGARASWDALRRRSETHAANAVSNVASAALLIQIAWVYVETGLRKTGVTWADGSALYYALHYDVHTSALGVWFRQFHTLLAVSTPVVRTFEIAGPLLAFSPFWNGRLRLLAVLLFAGFHVVLGLLMNLLTFPYVCIAAWLVFLPTEFWDRVAGLPAAPLRMLAAPAEGLARGAHVAAQCVAGLAIVYVMATNLVNTARALRLTSFEVPSVALTPGRVLRLNQGWAMFAPDPQPFDSWFVFDGELATGEHVEVLHDEPVSFAVPDPLRDWYPSDRWMIYLERGMWTTGPASVARHEAMVRYLCRSWPERRPEAPPLRSIVTWRVVQPTTPDGESLLEPVPFYLGRCAD